MQTALDLSRAFLPEALAGLAVALESEEEGHVLACNQIRAASYLHIFDLFETCLADAARAQAARDIDARDALVPLLRLDAFDHNELFRGFERSFAEVFPVTLRRLERPRDLDDILLDGAPIALLILALHLKLVTQQHYLACVRGDESLEPTFVKVLKDHWSMECGHGHKQQSLAIQQALASTLPGRIPSALRDYRRIIFVCDDVLHRQSELDIETLEEVRGAPLSASSREIIRKAQADAHRKTFLTFGIVNAAFVYAMRCLGPTAPSMLAGVVSALSARA